jgi:KRAB domain-containing zinc finger protein
VIGTFQLALVSRFCLRYHLTSHSGERPFVCAECAKRFRNQRDLRTHERTLHASGGGPEVGPPTTSFPCPLCHLSFGTLGAARAHKRLAHGGGGGGGKEAFQCGTCKKKFVAASQLEMHVR